MEILNALIDAASFGSKYVDFDYDVYIKVDGTWELIGNYPSNDFIFLPDGPPALYANMTESPEYENTGGTAVDVTHVCVGAVTTSGELTAGLNSDEAAQGNSLVCPIATVDDGPITVQPSEIVRFNMIRTQLRTE